MRSRTSTTFAPVLSDQSSPSELGKRPRSVVATNPETLWEFGAPNQRAKWPLQHIAEITRWSVGVGFRNKLGI